jgi:hypothetical protein
VTITANNRKLLGPQPIINGRLSIALLEQPPVITLRVEASGCDVRVLNVIISGSKVELGKIALDPAAAIKVDQPIVFAVPAQHIERVDFVVRNEASAPLHVRAVHLSGIRRRKTECYDLVTPDISISLDGRIALDTDKPQTVPAVVQTRRPAAKDNLPPVRATYRSGPCRQAELEIDYSLLFALAPKESLRMSLKVPYSAGKSGEPAPIDLSHWDSVVVRVEWTDESGQKTGTATSKDAAPTLL